MWHRNNFSVSFADEQRWELPWQDVSKPVERRVLALLSNMTMEEKISQLSSNSAAIDRLQIPAFNWWTGEALKLLVMIGKCRHAT